MADTKKWSEAECDTRFIVGVVMGMIGQYVYPDESRWALVAHIAFNIVFLSAALWALRSFRRRRVAE